MHPQKGGVQKVCSILTNFFIDRGHSVYYLLHEKQSDDNYQYPVNIYYLPDSYFFSEVNLNYYQKLIGDLKIDIIINHDASNKRSVLFLNSGNHAVRKISLHHNDPLIRFNCNAKQTGLKKFLPGFLIDIYNRYKTKREINFLLENSDRVVLLSEAFVENIKVKTGIESDKLLAISNPVLIPKVEKELIKRKQILFVGRIELEQKRPDLLLEIWKKVYSVFPDWELIVLGDGPDKKYIEQCSIEMGLTNITFKGFVDPEPYYQQASIICMTSDYEGFGMVLIEAMQYGVIPISFNNWASLQDIIIDNETGILAPANDLEAYSYKLMEIMRGDGLRSRIAVNALNHALQFDINKIGEKWINLFNSLTSCFLLATL